MLTRTLSLLIGIFLAGCATSSKSFYVLTADGSAPSGSGMGIGVGPIALAEYIDRPNLVIAESPNQLSIADDHRWAGDLGSSVARVTAANLGRRLNTGNVRTYPWRDDNGLRYQVTIDIRQLHGSGDGHAIIEAGWRIYALPERRVAAARTFVDREPLQADGYPALVAAQSKLLSRLAADIASAMK